MHLKSTTDRTGNRSGTNVHSPRFFRGRAGAAAMTRAIATLALAGAALGMLVSPVQAQERDEVLQSVSEGATDLPNDNNTPGRVAVGGSATGTIGTASYQDEQAGPGGTDRRAEPRALPPRPTGFAVSNGNEQVTLTWDAPAEDADITHHEYRFKTTGDYLDEWTAINDSAPGGLYEDWVVVTDLTNDEAYTFQLRAVNADGDGSTAAEAGPATPRSGVCGRTEQVRDAIVAADRRPPRVGLRRRHEGATGRRDVSGFRICRASGPCGRATSPA